MAKKRTQKTVLSGMDPSQNIWQGRQQPLDTLFRPKSVALVGASASSGSVGKTLMQNLLQKTYKGKVYAVNPNRKKLMGVSCCGSVKKIGEPVDLAVIATPAKTVPFVVNECVEAGIKSAIIISAGFKELGAPGEALEKEILKISSGKMRIIGPNCLGVMTPPIGFNATFADRLARPGNVAFISQSGALCTAILDWSFKSYVGFSAFVSIGSMLDVDWGDLIDYLGEDDDTKSILIYMETIGNARSFLSAAREVALTKPIIVLKAGRTEAAAKAAASHTGSIAGSDQALDAAFDRSGVLRVDRIEELFDMAEVLAKQTRPKGPRLTIVTNAGGPGVLTTDAFIRDGGVLTELSDKTIKELDAILPAHWSHANPIDILGDAGPDRYAKAIEIASKDENADGVLVLLTPQAMTDPTKTAKILAQYKSQIQKPLLASWMGGESVDPGRAVLKNAGIPVFNYPDRASRIFYYMWKYSHNLESLYKTPVLAEDGAEWEGSVDADILPSLTASADRENRTVLTEEESKKLLEAYGLPVVTTRMASNPDEAAALAREMGYPVVLKLYSKTITHKSDVGGVQLDLKNDQDVRLAFSRIESEVTRRAGREHFMGVTVQRMIRQDGTELILGSTVDAQLGPILLFGAGGRLVEVLEDHALGLPPLNSTLARRLIEQTAIYKILKGVRGKASVDFAKLEQILVRFSRLVAEARRFREIEINPLLASSEGFVALDARAVLYPADTPVEKRPRLAIRPYPERYSWDWTSAKGLRFKIRPMRPEDEPMVVKFHYTLSEESVRNRYFGPFRLDVRTSHERLVRVCQNDYDRDIALAAILEKKGQPSQIMGVGRLSGLHSKDPEFSLIITDTMQHQGLGSKLLQSLIEIARCEKARSIQADILSDNRTMQHLCQRMGFTILEKPGAPTVRAELKLTN